MAREATVTLTLREEDARWLLGYIKRGHYTTLPAALNITDELRHALAECECGEEGR